MILKELKKDLRRRMEGAVRHFADELKTIRTGRASVVMVEHLKVPYYDQETPLNQVASLSVPDPTMIIVQPWDPSILGEIEKVIRSSDLGFNPINDGKILKIPVPPLTEERRKELVKKTKDLAEQTRQIIRQIRRDGKETLKKKEKAKEISEDDMHLGFKEVQELHDEFIKEINELLDAKEKEILGD